MVERRPMEGQLSIILKQSTPWIDLLQERPPTVPTRPTWIYTCMMTKTMVPYHGSQYNWHMSETQIPSTVQGRAFEDVSASDRGLPPHHQYMCEIWVRKLMEGRRTPAIEQSNQTCIIIKISSLIMDVLLPSGGNKHACPKIIYIFANTKESRMLFMYIIAQVIPNVELETNIITHTL